MKSKQIFLTPAAGKRLIALALAQDETLLKAARGHRVVIVAGTTNGYVAEELLRAIGETGFERRRFFRGTIRRQGIPESFGKLDGDVIIERGKWISGKRIDDVAKDLRAGDVVIKGANAVHLKSGCTAILAGNPTSGTIGHIYAAVVGRRVRLITPVGVEKRVEEPIHRLCALCNAGENKNLRLAPSPGEAYTEIDAIRAMTGAEAHIIAAGGVCGCEGGVFLQCEGTHEQLSALRSVMEKIGGEPKFELKED